MTPRERLADARLYLVCDARPAGVPRRRAARRRRRRPAARQDARRRRADRGRARAFRAAADAHGALFILNDRPDLVGRVRRRRRARRPGRRHAAPRRARSSGPTRIVGLSTHAPAQADAADADPDVDYLAVGPVHATPTKPGRPAAGLDYVAYAARSVAQAVVRDRRARRRRRCRRRRARRPPRGRRARDHRGRRPRGAPRAALRAALEVRRWGSAAVSGAAPAGERPAPRRASRPDEPRLRRASRERARDAAPRRARAARARASARARSPSPRSSPRCSALAQHRRLRRRLRRRGGERPNACGGLRLRGVMLVAAGRDVARQLLGRARLPGAARPHRSSSRRLALLRRLERRRRSCSRSCVIAVGAARCSGTSIRAMARLQMPEPHAARFCRPWPTPPTTASSSARVPAATSPPSAPPSSG